MKPRLIIILLFLVIVPLGLMAWLGLRVMQSERAAVQESFRKLHLSKLRDVEAGISKVIERRERELLSLAGSLTPEPAALRAAARKNPAVSQIFWLNEKGRLIHPDIATRLSRPEQEFLVRAQQVWKDQAIFFRPAEEGAQPAARQHGWYSWYWGSGINFILWQRDASGRVAGFELDRFRLIADIIAELPDSELTPKPESPEGAVALLDSKDEIIYQWGRHHPEREEQPIVSLTLGAPLNPWRLGFYSPGGGPAAALGSGAAFSLTMALIAVGLALLGLAFYFYRESSREIRAARQRVSFVNHVSHELKTPLTNIRLYAELLEYTTEQNDEKAARYLEVVVSESQRLSRLIDNVLTFGRQQQGALKLRKTEAVVDTIVTEVIESHRPSLQAKGVLVQFDPGAPDRVRVDADALKQIVSNLLGNVEKYAPETGQAQVSTGFNDGTTVITVSDQGPGVPPAQRQNIFLPFVRLSSRVSDGVAGTGIGLSIARDLARQHGGDLTLEPSDRGATFKVTLATEVE